MSPRSPLFKRLLWKAFASGRLVGATVHRGQGRAYAPCRFYFRDEIHALRFAAKIEEDGGPLANDHKLGAAHGQQGLYYFVEIPLSSIRQPRQPLAFPVRGGVRGLLATYDQLTAL
ncbi:MAG: hypothetical protein R3C14_40560 [Caldilineaceae bacterium]